MLGNVRLKVGRTLLTSRNSSFGILQLVLVGLGTWTFRPQLPYRDCKLLRLFSPEF